MRKRNKKIEEKKKKHRRSNKHNPEVREAIRPPRNQVNATRPPVLYIQLLPRQQIVELFGQTRKHDERQKKEKRYVYMLIEKSETNIEASVVIS